MKDRTDVLNPGFWRKFRRPILFFFLFLGLIVVDLIYDLLSGEPAEHLVFDLLTEGLIIAAAALSLSSLGLIYWREREKSSFPEDFKKHIAGEFDRWCLTQSERQIAWLLLGGLEIKAIAHKRFTSERTVRNQTRAIYEKSRLSGRAELSAYFFNGLIDRTERSREEITL